MALDSKLPLIGHREKFFADEEIEPYTLPPVSHTSKGSPMKSSPFKKRYELLVKASMEEPSVPKRLATLRAWTERNMALNEVGKQILHYGFTPRELRKAVEAAKIDAEFDRKYGKQVQDNHE